MLRFYKGGITRTDIEQMPMPEFDGYVKAIEKISELETGEKKEKSLTGKAGAKAAKAMFGVK